MGNSDELFNRLLNDNFLNIPREYRCIVDVITIEHRLIAVTPQLYCTDYTRCYMCTGVLVYWCTGVLVYLCTCVLVYWCTGVLVYWCTGVLVYWCTGVLVYWCTCVLVYWCTGVLVYLCTGVLVYWCTGVLVYWCRLSTDESKCFMTSSYVCGTQLCIVITKQLFTLNNRV